MKESVVDFCPVPREQQPINEYEDLKDSWFFRWATLELVNYCKKLIWVVWWSLLITVPIATASFHPFHSPLKFTLTTIAGSGFFLTLVLSRLYLGWSYIRDRLHNNKIFYEESGWYDGQAWLKPQNMLNRDRLIVSYQIEPILNRLQKTFCFLAALIISESIIWLILG